MTCMAHFACNYHRHGTFKGVFSHASFEGAGWHCSVESPYWNRGLRISYASRPSDQRSLIVIGRQFLLPYISYREWVGNWCWDAACVADDDCKRLMRALSRLGWQIDSGTEDVWEWWKREQKAKGRR